MEEQAAPRFPWQPLDLRFAEWLEVFIFGWKGKIHLEEEAAPRSRWQPLFLCSLFRKFDVCSETS